MTYPTNAYQPQTQPQPAPVAPPAAQLPPAVSPLKAPIKFKSRHTFPSKYSTALRTKFAVDTAQGEIMVFCDIDDLNPYQAGQDIIAVQSRGGGWKLDASATRALYGEASARDQAHVNKTMPVPVPQPAPIPQAQPATKPPAPASGGGYKGREKPAIDISKPGVYDAVIDLAAASMMDLKRKTADVSEESCQKLASTALIRFLDSATEDQLIQWAARNAKKDMGF